MTRNNIAALDPHVAITRDGPVAVAELNNPAKRNAMTPGMWDTLEAFARTVSNDASVRVVLIRGAGDAFSAGADITGFETGRAGEAGARAYDERLEIACCAIETIAQPVVARLDGPVVGAGLELAASCDLRIASEAARLMIPAARLGLGFDPRAVARLHRAFGPAMARTLMLMGGPVAAERAHVLGAIDQLVPADTLDEATARLLGKIAAGAPLSLAAGKLSLRAAAHDNSPKLLDEAWRLTHAANASDDYGEGRAAFAERRPPRFNGR